MKREKGVTIFLTTHYMDETELLADRIAIMEGGRIIAEGTAEELKRLVGNDVIYLRLEGRAECLEADFVKGFRVLPDGRIRLDVNNAAEALPKLFEVAKEINLRITGVTYHRPTLNDVFLHLTGREIRDEEGNPLKGIMRRWGRLR